MKGFVFFMALLCALLTQPVSLAQEAPEHETENSGLVEAVASRDFNYLGLQTPVWKNLVFDTQYYWVKDEGSKALAGVDYALRFKSLRLTPGILAVSQSCEKTNKPAGCWDAAAALGWEWESRSWSSRGFLLQSLADPQRRFGFADPVTVYRRSKNGKWQFGLYLIGEEAKEKSEDDEPARLKLHLNAGLGLRRTWGGFYLEPAVLFRPGGFRLTLGREFSGFHRH